MKRKTVKCYQCKCDIPKDEAIIEIHKPNKVEYRRYLHKDCHQDYLLVLEEVKKWDSLYRYVQKEIFNYDDNQSLSRYCVNRLQGLRSGNYGAKRNTKVFLSENGYSYETILLTFKVKKKDILFALSDKSRFNDETHRVNLIISYIQNGINDVYIKIKEKERNDELLKGKDYSGYVDNTDVEFINKSNIKENKVANILDNLW